MQLQCAVQKKSFIKTDHQKSPDKHADLQVTENPHLSDERVRQIEPALEPDDRKKCSTWHMLEKIDIRHLIDKNVDLEPGFDADRDSRLRLNHKNGFVF